ncbi:MAG: nitroreductase, partial [Frondihabitans sp.]|nr:nitroreductase [Frondihabitans sp.]
MPLDGTYVPGTSDWAAKQAAEIEESGGTQATELRGMPVIVL